MWIVQSPLAVEPADLAVRNVQAHDFFDRLELFERRGDGTIGLCGVVMQDVDAYFAAQGFGFA